MEKETLEEAAKKYATNHGMMAYMSTEKKESFKKGAKWQQEQDKNKYSEEEVIELLKTFDEKFNSGIVERNKGINNWFEQFKKK